MQATKEQVIGVLEIVALVGQVIREKKEIPNGELYARLMGKFSIQEYTMIIDTLKKSGLVTEKSNLLIWIGPS